MLGILKAHQQCSTLQGAKCQSCSVMTLTYSIMMLPQIFLLKGCVGFTEKASSFSVIYELGQECVNDDEFERNEVAKVICQLEDERVEGIASDVRYVSDDS